MAPSLAHRSPLAGVWYPADPGALAQLLQENIERSINRTGPFVRPGGLGFIVPHAGPRYCGAVAASVYRHIQASGASRILLLGFSHRGLFAGLGIPTVARYETPLGVVRVDRATADRLAASPPFHEVPESEVCDHSVEIQLPFLQTLVPAARVVPIYAGQIPGPERREAAEVLRSLLDDDTVLVASSDLTHYGRDFGYVPFALDDATPENLRSLDMKALGAVGSLDTAIFRRELRESGATVCGVEPIQLLMETLSGLGMEIFEEVIDYETSGDITHDYQHSVSYGAAGFFPSASFEVGEEDQAALLASARYTLDHYRATGAQRFLEHPSKPSLLQRGRAFVTLYGPDSIRGCIGCFENTLALADSVPRLAISASRDTRFGLAAATEPLRIEVHILTPPRRISEAAQIRIGTHGVVLKADGRRGLLLASVATKLGLSPREFLRELAHKAGVSDNVYASGGFELSVFCDQSFQEAA